MSVHVHQNQTFSEVSDAYIGLGSTHEYASIDDRPNAPPTSAHHHQNLEMRRQAATPSPADNTQTQAGCKAPPWWGSVLIVIGVLLLVAVAIAIYFFTTRACTPIPAGGTPFVPTRDITDCSEVDTSGIYTIVRSGLNIKVYCQVEDEDKFVVIQKREDGSVNFYRNWASYRQGFGDLAGEHWLGNDNIHALTAAGYTRLRIDLVDWNNTRHTVYYRIFQVLDEENKYKLTVSGFSGSTPPGDAFISLHNGMKFSTYDEDNGISSGNCASRSLGAWWYKNCHNSNLNGEYNNTDGKGIIWYQWTGPNYSLKKTAMMLTVL